VQGDAGHPGNKVVDPKRIIGKKWRAEEEERHKGSLTQKKIYSAVVVTRDSRIGSRPCSTLAPTALYFYFKPSL
jgi:hypothetical protein